MRKLTQIIVILLLYYLTARLGFLMALPPGNVTALWPPSGLALAAMLVLGWESSIGIFLGSLWVNFETLSGANALWTSVAIATGSTIQAWLGALVLKRFIGAFPPKIVQQVIKAFIFTAFTTLVAMLFGVTSLCLAGYATWDTYPQLALTWWSGDFIGICIFTPLLVTGYIRLTTRQPRDPVTWALTGGLVGLSLFAFFAIQHAEAQNLQTQLVADSNEIKNAIQSHLDRDIQSLYAIRALYESDEQVTRLEFISFTAPFLQRTPTTIHALSWVPNVQQENLTVFEDSLQADLPGFQAFEKAADGKNIPVLPRSEHFIVSFITPIEANKTAVGFDIGSNAARLETIQRTRDTGQPSATAPIQLVQETSEQKGILIMVPIYKAGASLDAVEARRANLTGLANGVFRLGDLAENTMRSINQHDVEMYLYDVDPVNGATFMAYTPSVSGTAPDNPALPLEAAQTGIHLSIAFEQYGRQWVIVTRPGPKYIANFYSMAPWVALLAGLFVTAAFLITTQTRQKTEQILANSEREFRNLSEQSLTGIARLNNLGQITYANSAAIQIFGQDSSAKLLGRQIKSFVTDQTAFEAVFQTLLTGEPIHNFEMEIMNDRGEKVNLLYSATWYGSMVSANIVDITEKVRADREIRQLSGVVAQMADTVLITNLDGSIEYVNPAFERLTGYTQAEVIGKTPRILKSGLQSDELYKELWDTILQGHVFQTELINKKKNGELYSETITITPILDSNGKIIKYAATGKDVTERKRAEALQEAVYQITTAAHNTPSLQELYPQIHYQVGRVMPATNFYIAMLDEATNLLQFVYFVDEQDAWDTEPFSSDMGLTGYVLRTGRSLLCDETMDRELLASGEYHPSGAPSKIWLGVPLKVHGRTIGVMAVQDYFEEHAYTEREQRMLEFVSQQIATAIDLKQNEEALKTIEKRNSALIAHAPDGIALMDEQGRYIFGSPSAIRLFGYAAEEFVGHSALDWVHPDDRLAIRKGFSELVRDPSKVFTAEYRYLHQDGIYRWVEGTFSNIAVETGSIAIVINFRDITERKNALLLLQKSQQSLETAQATAHLGSWELDPVSGIGMWSREMFHLFGRDPDLGVPPLDEFLQLVDSADREALLHAQQTAIETGSPIVVEYCTMPNAKKARRCFQATISPVKDAAGQLIHMAGTVLDITEIKTAQHELEMLNRELEKRVEERTAEVRHSEATYRALFENSNDGIFLMSNTGEELRANQRALSMVGYTLEEYLSMGQTRQNPFTQFPEQREDADRRLEAVLRGENVPLYERTFIAKSGQKVEVEINLSPVRDPNGQIIMLQSVVRDITERKRAEAALRESRDQLQEANFALEKAARLKDEFLASMSHELRTPLTSILGLAETLQLNTYGPLNEKQVKALTIIESSGRHLLDLINDILDLSKVESGKLDVHFEPCSISEICQASLQLVNGLAGQKKQKISFQMIPAVITLQADKRRLKQILVNLLSNAVKFTSEGGQLGLEVTGHEDLKNVTFKVWDKGIGIKAEDISKLFKPFVQLDSRLAREYSGTGLGLSLVKRMVTLHGGSIEVESTPGDGSVFTVTLPWSAEITQPMRAIRRKTTGSLRNTMVIEDNDLDAVHILHQLRELGINNATMYPSITGALERAVQLQPSIILLDLHLPDGFGMDLLTQLKADSRTKNIPVIITSVEERRTEALQLGAVGYLVKPFTKDELHAELTKAALYMRPADPVLVVGKRSTKPLVVVADDNQLNLEMVQDFMEAKGFLVRTVQSGPELLESLSDLRPDIILVDIQMPGMDGLEVMQRIRALPDPQLAKTPMIAVTALAMVGDREKCLDAGANDYISKPVVLKTLVDMVNKLLQEKL